MSHVSGLTAGLKKSELKQLERLERRAVSTDQFIAPALAEELCQLALEIARPLTLLIDRRGRVIQVYVGPLSSLGEEQAVSLPLRPNRLSGVRAVTCQFESMAEPDKAAQTTLLQYCLDCVITLTASQHPQWSAQFGESPKAADAVRVSRLEASSENKLVVAHDEPHTLHQMERQSFEGFLELAESDLIKVFQQKDGDRRERAYLLGLAKPGKKHLAEDLLDELSLLSKTAGANVVGRTYQVKDMPDNKFYIGKGKAAELAFDMQQLQVDLVICDDELSAVQQRTLERVLRTRVIDRTQLILDIFAMRAQSYEGKIQVELAQLQYLLPRLAGKGLGLSQQTAAARGGTIATRGPGETKLELDRRHLRSRIHELERKAEGVRQHRQLQRKERLEKQMPIIALVGYTNAGKSTLMNTLTQAGVLTEDKLFATLDPVARKLVRPDMPASLLIDTVGFIQKLPTTLVKAFRSTLEEIQTADLIWHVADIAHPDRLVHFQSVQRTLDELDCSDKPQWLLFNKVDKVNNLDAELLALQSITDNYESFPISARSAETLEPLLQELGDFLEQHPLETAVSETLY